MFSGVVEWFVLLSLSGVAEEDEVEVDEEGLGVSAVGAQVEDVVLHVGLEKKIHQLVAFILLVDLLEDGGFGKIGRSHFAVLLHLLVK